MPPTLLVVQTKQHKPSSRLLRGTDKPRSELYCWFRPSSKLLRTDQILLRKLGSTQQRHSDKRRAGGRETADLPPSPELGRYATFRDRESVSAICCRGAAMMSVHECPRLRGN